MFLVVRTAQVFLILKRFPVFQQLCQMEQIPEDNSQQYRSFPPFPFKYIPPQFVLLKRLSLKHLNELNYDFHIICALSMKSRKKSNWCPHEVSKISLCSKPSVKVFEKIHQELQRHWLQRDLWCVFEKCFANREGTTIFVWRTPKILLLLNSYAIQLSKTQHEDF